MDNFFFPSQQRNSRRGENSRLFFLPPAPSCALWHPGEGLEKDQGEGLGKGNPHQSLGMSSTPQRTPRAGRKAKIPSAASPRLLSHPGFHPFILAGFFSVPKPSGTGRKGVKAPFPPFQPPGGIVETLPGKSPLSRDGESPDPSRQELRDEGSLLQGRKISHWGFSRLFRGFLSPATGWWNRGIFCQGPPSSSSPVYPAPAALPGGSGMGMKIPNHSTMSWGSSSCCSASPSHPPLLPAPPIPFFSGSLS